MAGNQNGAGTEDPKAQVQSSRTADLQMSDQSSACTVVDLADDDDDEPVDLTNSSCENNDPSFTPSADNGNRTVIASQLANGGEV